MMGTPFLYLMGLWYLFTTFVLFLSNGFSVGIAILFVISLVPIAAGYWIDRKYN